MKVFISSVSLKEDRRGWEEQLYETQERLILKEDQQDLVPEGYGE